MTSAPKNPFSATASLVGYLYQCRYAIFDSLRRLRNGDSFTVAIETLDDVAFATTGEPLELLQTKHHVDRAGDLTDASPDLWKSIRIWCEGRVSGAIPEGSTCYLVTTGLAPTGSASSYLRPTSDRDESKAVERMRATAVSSTNKANVAGYAAFLALSQPQQMALAAAIQILDNQATIADLDAALRQVVYFAASSQHLDAFLQRLEGWWLQRVIKHLCNRGSQVILSEEIESETARLREQFKLDSLPIDDDILQATVDVSGYQGMTFVHQLRLIAIGNERVLHAIRNYFRAFEQRSRWVREDLLLVGELDRYEGRLVEEWDLLFQGMRDSLGDGPSEESKRESAQALYKWVETGTHRPIRPGVTEPAIARGSYHMLSDGRRVGWHLDYATLLRRLLEPEET